ncbi:uncharacterized protein DUF4352 [Salsuginibacillus halophilus]|uniref:Uncharacterized protein DUF4352 n=1 Tax=Salsuginibacillus halophilus TaxID=517424 RepID=A0A2P8HYL3_9BACI|nr:DUF4352 domain-containing protein [Salsuginibacillus halophilus]PSL51332.1 uncharacterized protein DUF4352 [Salsuginibacillus halophilus]
MQKKLGVLVGLVFLLGFLSGTFMQSNHASGSFGEDVAAVSQTSDHLLSLGETASIGGLNVTVNDAYQETGDEDESYLVVDVTFFNPHEDIQQISLFNALLVDEDGYAYEYDETYGDRRLIGGQVRPEGQRRGTIAFEVDPADYYEFNYTDHTAGGQAAWIVSEADR